MWWDRFDIVEAYLVFFMEYHEGQGSDRYRRLSRMSLYFRPSPLLCGPDQLSENGRVIYDNLVEKENKRVA